MARRARKPQGRKGGGRQYEVQIQDLGARGDGLAKTPDGQSLFVPLTLPGERVRVRTLSKTDQGFQAELLELIEPANGRVEPPCPHFGLCGGCQLQHLDPTAEHAWKQARLAAVLERLGQAPDKLRPFQALPHAKRRRARLGFFKEGKRLEVGFLAARSHRNVDTPLCQVLAPELHTGREALERLLTDLPGRWQGQVSLTQTATGLDLLLDLREEPDLALREKIAAWAEEEDLARLVWQDEILVERRTPSLRLGALSVPYPPGSFLQASLAGEEALRTLVLEAVPLDARHVADLFCGLGTFALPLAQRGAQVWALDSDGLGLAGLDTAVRRSAGRLPVQAEARDLFTWPLVGEELEGIDALVFDPPRAGARDQATALAASTIPCLVAVSCNPATFARDAALLLEGGYSLDWMQGIDQFPWTGHIELVARFSRRP